MFLRREAEVECLRRWPGGKQPGQIDGNMVEWVIIQAQEYVVEIFCSSRRFLTSPTHSTQILGQVQVPKSSLVATLTEGVNKFSSCESWHCLAVPCRI